MPLHPLTKSFSDICYTVFQCISIASVAALQRGVSPKVEGEEEVDEAQWVEDIEDEELGQILGIFCTAQMLVTYVLPIAAHGGKHEKY